MVSYSFDLEITPGSMPPILHMAQYDSGRTYTANLKNNGVAFSPTQGSTAKIKGRNPGGVCWEQEAEVSGSTVTFTPEGAATDQFGIMPVQLEITKEDTISTLIIIFDIQRAGYTSEEAASSPEFETAMEQAVAAAIADGGLGFTEEFKTALLACFAHVVWDDDGQDYYDALEAALYPDVTLLSITADYQQDHPIYDTDDLDAIKVSDDLTVTANYSDGSSVVLADDDYTLSGTLTVGTSTITVSYGNKETTITVVVTSYWGTTWEFADGNPTDHGFRVGVGSGASAGMGSSYYYLTASSSAGVSISGDPDFTGTSGVYEIEFMFPALPSSSFYYGGPGVRFVFTGNKIQMYQTPYDSSLTDVYTGVQANTWYKARLEFAPNTIPILTLNDTVIEPSFLCGWDGARFLLGVSKNAGSVYIKSIKIREET